ncbi:hypothetical protein ACFPES_23060 [Paenibacillus sp. GCM10023248]|uniref:hypothetical protein n=1 Tax=Bacillales TaxID=1385 RepID=UPI002377EF99|nr:MULTISPECIES: hypothetical protein [Bacillales]MDD9269939.1 hypothetical protein [Paenibacillus sp. MAHUQ-63]MDR6883159.1 hypothetical protein [Bacillus sp. 3255]
MAKQIVDAFQSIPSTSTGSISRPIPAAPSSIILADFGLTFGANTSVYLSATVGYAATLGLPDVTFRIVRDTLPIFTITSSNLTLLEQGNLSFNTVDINPPAGSHNYRLIADVSSALTIATVIGPVAISGIAIATV